MKYNLRFLVRFIMNLFLPVYKRLDEEVASLTDTIFFDDYQLDVYSLAIGDLLIRCVIEIEAISKELYIRLGGNAQPLDKMGKQRDLYFDTDCISLLVDKWNIDKKKLQITNTNMYFSKELSVITPLYKSHKRGTSGSQWKRAYQSFKHFRSKSIKKATIGNLINALGALYILNLYYSEESFWEDKPIKGLREYSIDSKIFSPFVFDATNITFGDITNSNSVNSEKNMPLDDCVYVKRLTDTAFRTGHEEFCKFEIRTILKVKQSKEYEEYRKKHPEIEKMSVPELIHLLGGRFIPIYAQDIRALFDALKSTIVNKEVSLNMNEPFYPELTKEEYLKTEGGKQYLSEIVKSLM